MFRLLLIALCLAVPTFSFATTALPPDFCSYGNFEQHPAPPPQTLPKAAEDYSNANEEKFQLRLTGGNGGFSGFAIQAQDPSGVPVGRFQIIDEHNSKTMACKHLDDSDFSLYRIRSCMRKLKRIARSRVLTSLGYLLVIKALCVLLLPWQRREDSGYAVHLKKLTYKSNEELC